MIINFINWILLHIVYCVSCRKDYKIFIFNDYDTLMKIKSGNIK